MFAVPVPEVMSAAACAGVVFIAFSIAVLVYIHSGK